MGKLKEWMTDILTGLGILSILAGWIIWGSGLSYRVDTLEKKNNELSIQSKQLDLSIQDIKIGIARIETKLEELKDNAKK
jgi:hypothetical protein